MNKLASFIVLSGLMLAASDAVAQELTTLAGWPVPQKNLVRQWNENCSIHYMEIGSVHRFVLHDLADSSNVIVATFPANYEVNDFEIYDSTVYFCGTIPNGGDPYGIAGYIAIKDLFYYNQPYNYCFINQMYFIDPNTPTNTHITSLDRMDVFEDAGRIHIAAVGEMAHGSGYNELRRTVCDIQYTGSWNGMALYQKEDIYKPSDITCTDHTIVASAYDDNTSYSILLAFKKNTDFPATPLYPYSIRIGDRRVGDNVLVERLWNDNIAVSHYSHDPSTGDYSVAVHQLDNVYLLPTPPYHISVHHSIGSIAPGTPIRDLRYNLASDVLMLLFDYPVTMWGPSPSSVLEFQTAFLPYFSGNVWYSTQNVLLRALDNHVQHPLFSLGGTHIPLGEPIMTIKNNGDPTCFHPEGITFKDVSPSVSFSTGVFDPETIQFRRFNYTTYPNPYKTPIKEHCE